MSDIAGAPSPPPGVVGVAIGGACYQRSASPVRRSEKKTPLRLPSLGVPARAVASGRGVNGSRLSLSEPSLHHTKDGTSFEACCCVRPAPSCKSRAPSKLHSPPTSSHTQTFQSTYIHLYHSIRLNSKPRPARPPSHTSATAGDLLGPLGPLAMHVHKPEPLSVIGKPCVLNFNQRPVTGFMRPQLHVFLPTEAVEETDNKSLDESFMDAKMASLRLRKEDCN
nr:uncharacterized protein LOC125986583 [Syngnathus scovelli]